MTKEQIAAIAIAVRTRITRDWHQPDWNYMYYDFVEKAVSDGISLALKQAEADNRLATGPG